jgi:hypothetical protein
VTVTKRVFRLIRFDGGRVLLATGLDGAEYQIVLTSRAHVVPAVMRPGEFADLSRLRPGDRLIVDGTARDGGLLANRLEVPGGLRGDRIAATGIDPR